MAEQGDIDWANHGNDFARMVGTIKDLHDGVQAVIDFVNQPDDYEDLVKRILSHRQGTLYYRPIEKGRTT